MGTPVKSRLTSETVKYRLETPKTVTNHNIFTQQIPHMNTDYAMPVDKAANLSSINLDADGFGVVKRLNDSNTQLKSQLEEITDKYVKLTMKHMNVCTELEASEFKTGFLKQRVTEVEKTLSILTDEVSEGESMILATNSSELLAASRRREENLVKQQLLLQQQRQELKKEKGKIETENQELKAILAVGNIRNIDNLDEGMGRDEKNLNKNEYTNIIESQKEQIRELQKELGKENKIVQMLENELEQIPQIITVFHQKRAEYLDKIDDLENKLSSISNNNSNIGIDVVKTEQTLSPQPPSLKDGENNNKQHIRMHDFTAFHCDTCKSNLVII